MDSKSIIERIKDVHLLKSDAPSVWSKLTDEFPYFAGAQWLNYGCNSFHEKADKKLIRLYVSEPLEFVRYEAALKKEPLKPSPVLKAEEPIAQNIVTSIIENAEKPKEIAHVETKNVKEEKSSISEQTEKPKEIRPAETKAINHDKSTIGKQAEKPKEIPLVETKAVNENLPPFDKKVDQRKEIPSIKNKSQEINTSVKTEKENLTSKETPEVVQIKEVADLSQKIPAKPAPEEIKQKESKVTGEPKKEIKTVQEEPVKVSITAEKKWPDTKPDVIKQDEDILELINELPNSAPFKIPDLSQTSVKTTQGTLEVKEKNKPSKQEAIPISKNDSEEEDKSLMVVMSFTEWLNHFKHKTEIEKKEVKEKKALKAAWQKEKLAEAADEELEEIPEPLFKQAMESISMESTLISESLAEILAKQGKRDKAISMYKKLSLRNPEKSTYFADRINELNLNIE